MNAEIYDRYTHLNDSEAGKSAIENYVAAIADGKRADEAAVIGSNVLQHAGYNVNATGGASFRVASIDHNEIEGERVSLVIDNDRDGFFVATSDGEDTEMRFASADDAYDSIAGRWGNGWNLEFADND